MKNNNSSSITAFRNNAKKTNSACYKSKAVYLDKKNILGLKFDKSDTLECLEQQKNRKQLLKKGMRLGNEYKQKVKIFFRGLHNHFYTETTIWYVGKHYISLKGGVALPIRSIFKIEI